MKQLHPDDRERVLDQRRQMYEGGMEQFTIEYRFLHPTQGEKWLEHVACISQRDASWTGAPLAWRAAGRDSAEACGA